MFTEFCNFPFAKVVLTNLRCSAPPAAFKILLTVLSLIPFLNAFSNYYNSNRVDVLGGKYVFGPSLLRTHLK